MDKLSLKHQVIDYLLWHTEKIAIKEMFSGELYVKAYLHDDSINFFEKINQYFQNSPIIFENFSQDPPFINDDIQAQEFMVSF